MINYSTFIKMAKSLLLLAIFQLSCTQFAMAQGCAADISVSSADCAAGGFITVSGDFKSDPGVGDCPASITVFDGVNSVVFTGTGCQINGNETYFAATHNLDCSASSLSLTVGGITCQYSTGGNIIGSHTLPVELGSVSANLDDQGRITLRWITYTELNNDFFTIEKSEDGIHFEVIGEESGSGTSFEENRYSFTDETPTDGMNYYRLSQTDFDGTSEAFPVLSIDVTPKGNDQMNLFPNPTFGFVNLTFSEAISEKQATVNIQDLNGKLLQSQELLLEGATVRLDLGNVPQGMYIVTAQVGRQILHKKLSVY